MRVVVGTVVNLLPTGASSRAAAISTASSPPPHATISSALASRLRSLQSPSYPSTARRLVLRVERHSIAHTRLPADRTWWGVSAGARSFSGHPRRGPGADPGTLAHPLPCLRGDTYTAQYPPHPQCSSHVAAPCDEPSPARSCRLLTRTAPCVVSHRCVNMPSTPSSLPHLVPQPARVSQAPASTCELHSGQLGPGI
jgi:hypothetical protein